MSIQQHLLQRADRKVQMRRALFLSVVFFTLLSSRHGWAQQGTSSVDKPSPLEQSVLRTSGVDLRPCTFQNVTPGETLVDDALKLLGKPATDSEEEGSRTLVYHSEPFEKV